MALLTINHTTCTSCGICVQTCPVSIITLGEDKFPFVQDGSDKRCVLCGHCVSVCPESALTHNLLAETAPIRKEIKDQITPTNIAEYFKSRRSIRKFQSKVVAKPLLEEVFDIVSYAPTGVNSQMNKWVVVSDPMVIRQLSDGVIEWMKAAITVNPEFAKFLNFAGLIRMYEQGNDVICRHAPTLVIGYTHASYTGGTIDSVIATSHLEILLPAFGLGSCWAGYLMIALRYSPEMRKMIGLDDSHTIHSATLIGYPQYRYYKIPARKEPQVSWM